MKLLFFSTFLSLSALILLPSGAVHAWNTPWKYQPEPTSPWTSSERREGRESFFNSLAQADESNAAAGDLAPSDNSVEERAPVSAEDSRVASEEPVDDPQELTEEIPWRAHRSLYPLETFSKRLLWPVEDGRIGSGYGVRRGRFHEGLDIRASSGSLIRAVHDGRVVFSGKIRGYGNAVVIYHGDGVASVYAHNLSNTKKKGAMVKRGETIARVGQTGHATGPHCHFEVRRDGKPMNPLKFKYQQSPLMARR